MKLAVSGKGGAGKTTIASLLCRGLESRGREVIAIDADSNPNLAGALGFPAPEQITPLSEMKDLIRQKMGIERGAFAPYFRMNPDVADIPNRFRLTSGTVQLLVMGAIARGDSGCACPEFSLIRSIISYLLLNKDQDMVVDMEAGLEHLGRGVAEKVDALLIVVQPDRVSCLTAARIHQLARDLHIRNVYGVGNRIAGDGDLDYLQRQALPFQFISYFPACGLVRQSERDGSNLFAIPALRQEAENLIAHLAEKADG